ncbi:hypothetical protein [Actinocrispum sp. NPDC049592]|uniref:hypothetical protein n=1 Tax=Actinocrispum sp. NPDC049592 TaxID=3154835 RepID=UPI00341A8E71
MGTPFVLKAGDDVRVTCTHDAGLRKLLPQLKKLPPRHVVWVTAPATKCAPGFSSPHLPHERRLLLSPKPSSGETTPQADAPPRTPIWALLPLRVFLGGTFLYAGLSKILDTHYLDHTSPLGVHAQMLHATTTSPIGPLVSFAAEHPTVTGLVLALLRRRSSARALFVGSADEPAAFLAGAVRDLPAPAKAPVDQVVDAGTQIVPTSLVIRESARRRNPISDTNEKSPTYSHPVTALPPRPRYDPQE